MICRREQVRAEAVGAGCAAEEAELDEEAEGADNRDQADQQPPAGMVAVVAALDGDDQARPEQHEGDDDARQLAGEDQLDGDLQRRHRRPDESERLPVEPASRRQEELLVVHAAGPPRAGT